jgi:hypothetical protein
MLARQELAHLGTPAWSPNGRTLAFSRHPTGSGVNAAGDIWLVGIDGTGLRPLALTPADERAPCWSPDGKALAFSMEGDVWVAEVDVPGLQPALEQAAHDAEAQPGPPDGTEVAPTGTARLAAPASLAAPSSIRVMHDDVGNTCRPVPHGQIDVYPFEDYVRRVVPQEVPSGWPSETLKTQAVAARTYAWRKVLDRTGEAFDVWDSTNDQYMCEDTYASTDAAVDATEGQYVSYSGNVIYAFFCAEAGSPTHYWNVFGLSTVPAYIRPVDDPVSFAQARRGHSVGMSQWGAYRWAAWHGWNYLQILSHYYSSATIQRSSAFTEPLAEVTLPWPDWYVTTDHAYLQANAAGDGSVLTVTFAARVTDTWTTVYTDADSSDGWGYV